MKTSTLKLKLVGMHCVNCAVNIDLTLEDAKGVIKSDTSHTSNQTLVTYDSQTIKPKKIISLIQELGYQASILE